MKRSAPKTIPSSSGAETRAAAVVGFEDKIFYLALAMSFLAHLVALFCMFLANVHNVKAKPKAIELVYRAHPAREAVPPPEKETAQNLREERATPLPKMISQKPDLSGLGLQEPGKRPVKLGIPDKSAEKLMIHEQKRNISIPVLRSETITNPKYLNYHESIRAKIKGRAYLYVDDPRFQSGEVYLTFVLAANGRLEQVKIIAEKTSGNEYLQAVGLRSIKESAPFPPFPADLRYPELTFNVVISFEMEP